MSGHSPTDSRPTGKAAKALGAYYTDTQVADFLVWWAVRSRFDTVMDPSFGGGAFLRSACKRIKALGGDPGGQVFGVELDADVHRRIAGKLSDEFGVRKGNLRRSDFFRVDATPLEEVATVVGNPPYIRYQRFSGKIRRLALAKAAEHGVSLTELSSSWAPFLVHCVAMLRKRGRLAMVLPMEIGYATYAKPVMSHLSRAFERVVFLTFRKRLFPDLNEDTLLLLCENKGRPFAGFELRDFGSAGDLEGIQKGRTRRLDGTVGMNALALSRGQERFAEYLLPRKARALYRKLRESALVQRLGALAKVGIGYVTGANSYFHVSPDAARHWRIPSSCLRPAVCRGRAFAGLQFTTDDWRSALDSGDAAYLLWAGDRKTPPKAIRPYLEHGVRRGVPKAYKCRNRKPWYRVPNVYEADAFMTYMSGDSPRLVVNLSKAVAPNTLHVIRLHQDEAVPARAIASLWHTSLTKLSAEVEGHALGGGMLKLEPKEAENILIPVCRGSRLADVSVEFDSMVRSGREGEVQQRADEAILQEMLGLSRRDCRLLADGADVLKKRRNARGKVA